MQFDYYLPTEIISGENCVKKNKNIFISCGKKCLIVTGGSSAVKSGALSDCVSMLNEAAIEYIIFDKTEPNPLTTTCLEAGKLAKKEAVQFIIGIGGGSVLDAAKAVALFACEKSEDHLSLYNRTIPAEKLPVILIGTTAGTGSEVTSVSVMTNAENGRKKSISGKDCYADYSFCDFRYTETVPHDITVSTALDAFCHAVEAYLASTCNEMVEIFSFKAISLLRKYILCNFDISLNSREREELYIASIYAGLAINKAGTDFPHTVGYYLTENYNIPHGKACAVFMPALLKRAKKYCPEKLEAILKIMNCSFEDLCKSVKKSADVKIDITKDQAVLIAQRWKDGVKNFDRSPGGFTIEDAAEVLISF